MFQGVGKISRATEKQVSVCVCVRLLEQFGRTCNAVTLWSAFDAARRHRKLCNKTH